MLDTSRVKKSVHLTITSAVVKPGLVLIEELKTAKQFKTVEA